MKFKALVVNIDGIEYLIDSISRDWLGRFSYRLVMGSDYHMNYDPYFLNYKVASKFKEYLPTYAHLFGIGDENMMEVLQCLIQMVWYQGANK